MHELNVSDSQKIITHLCDIIVVPINKEISLKDEYFLFVVDIITLLSINEHPVKTHCVLTTILLKVYPTFLDILLN